LERQEIAGANEIYEEQDVDKSIKYALIESIFFATVGEAYTPIGLWVIR
jgi:hypothetical protein